MVSLAAKVSFVSVSARVRIDPGMPVKGDEEAARGCKALASLISRLLAYPDDLKGSAGFGGTFCSVNYLRVVSAAQFCSTVTPASASAACQAGIPTTIPKPAVVLLATK